MRHFFIVFWLVSILATPLEALYDPDMVWLSWQSDPTTTMSIQWIGYGIDPHNTVEYRPQGQKNWEQATARYIQLPGAKKLHINQLELTGLVANKAYQFRIGSDGMVYKFRTMPANSSEKILFVEGGDMYHDDVATMERISRVAAAFNPHFAVVGGDIAYSSGSGIPGENSDRWIVWLKSWKRTMVTGDGYLIPIVAAIGNHEVNGGFGETPEKARLFYSSFPLPQGKAYRVLDFGNYLSLLLLDSGHTAPVGGEQLQWLHETLASRVDRPFKFAVYHVPAYPSIRRFESHDSKVIRDTWVPVFDTFSLDVAFEHHDHDYKRTYRLKNNALNPHGTLYMGDGCWGIAQPRMHKQDRWYLVDHRPVRHFLTVTLENNTYTIRAVDERGHIFDEVTNPVPLSKVRNAQAQEPVPSTPDL